MDGQLKREDKTAGVILQNNAEEKDHSPGVVRAKSSNTFIINNQFKDSVSAGISEIGLRSRTEAPVAKAFVGSSPTPRTITSRHRTTARERWHALVGSQRADALRPVGQSTRRGPSCAVR